MLTKETVNLLATQYGKLPEKDQAFALSLLSAEKNGRLSAKQSEWITRLAERINAPPKPAVTIDTTSIRELFAKASSKLKFPKFTIQADDTTLQFSIAGAKSKVPGAINVTDGGKFGSNTFYGRVLPDGEWQAYAATEAITKTIKSFAANPSTVAAKHGRSTGNCCFCTKPLTDKTSVKVGYGKICADNWGLPYA